MRVLFVFPRWERFLESRPELSDLPYARRLDTFRVAPLSIPSVAAHTPSNVDIALFDDFDQNLDEAPKADLIALTAFTPQATRAFDIADHFRARGVPVVMGGIHASVLPDECLDHVDAVVVGEAEPLWPELLRDAQAGALKRMYRKPSVAPLTGLPHPRRDLFSSPSIGSLAVVQTGRGCFHRCPTCVLPTVQGRSVRLRPIPEVLAEIEALEASAFYLAEESLLFPEPKLRNYALELLEGLESIRKPFILASYPFLLEAVEPEFLERLARARCRQIYLVFGVDDQGTDAFWKQPDVVRAIVQKVGESRISLMGSFALGGEADDAGLFEGLHDFIHRTEINLAEFFFLTPYPGTPFHERLKTEGRLLDMPWSAYNGAHVVFDPKGMSREELDEGYVALWRSFYGGLDNYTSALKFVRGFGSNLLRRTSESDPDTPPPRPV